MSGMDDVAKGLLQHRVVLHELLELVEDEHVHFKPWDDAFSVSELAIHMVTSMDMYIKAIKAGEFAKPNTETDYTTMDDVRKIVSSYTEQTKKDIETIFDFQLKNNIELNQLNALGTYWLSNAIDHEIHHKGQFFTYVRLLGVKEVPYFMKHPFEV